ncbi:MAG TPA: YicC family protein [Albidovulum sp.]|uniref:YicC/YloC family endoribonuclease n=1 Tax=Albidovulum sp. TaxID=1872424 RepID=UPI002C91A9BA|nr:YicC family protein [Albidovulum sp.]
MVNHTLVSMTGFAERLGSGFGTDWVWEIRSVNGKGLDLRLRLPEGIEGLEAAVRAAVSAKVARGNVTLGLKLARGGEAAAPRVNATGLAAALDALAVVTRTAAERGLDLRTPAASEILTLRGVLESAAPEEDTAPLLAALLADLDRALAAFNAMRAAEGQALATVIAGQIGRIADLADQARTAADARRPQMEQTLRDNLARVLAGAAEADPARVAQELALLAVKSDVTEELDRLAAHVAAANRLLAEKGAVGRKFDFLMQEFMREANTLCSKSGNAELTRIGLDLKTVIDQMREQVQNVE